MAYAEKTNQAIQDELINTKEKLNQTEQELNKKTEMLKSQMAVTKKYQTVARWKFDGGNIVSAGMVTSSQ